MSAAANSLLHPAFLLALIAAGFGLCLYLFVVLKTQFGAALDRQQARHQSQTQALENKLRELEQTTAKLREEVRDALDRTGVLVPPAPPKSGLNLAKRTQALKMHRLGERPERIAAALEIPAQEVELLLKIHGIRVTGSGT